MTTMSGITLMRFLTDELKIEPSYVAKRISTIFIDGVPVEDLEAVRVVGGSVVALSAAMQGLVVSILRRRGHLAAMRTRLSRQKEYGAIGNPIWIKVKLFNTLVGELGPHLLEQGIWIRVSSLPGGEVKGDSGGKRLLLKADSGFPGEEILFFTLRDAHQGSQCDL